MGAFQLSNVFTATFIELLQKPIDIYHKNNKGETFLHQFVQYYGYNIELILEFTYYKDKSFSMAKPTLLSKIFQPSNNKFSDVKHRILSMDEKNSIVKMLNRQDQCDSISKKRKYEHMIIAATTGVKIPENIHFSSLLNCQNEDGDTALHIAVKFGNVPAVFALLKYSELDLDVKNFEGKTPLEISQKMIEEGEDIGVKKGLGQIKQLLTIASNKKQKIT